MHTLHIVSHTHWDREWYRTFQQFRLRLVHLVDGLLDLLEADPKFKFFMLDGQTIALDDYLLMRPEKRDLLRKYIQKGRLLIGPWHILPDMFLVGPEAHIRNLLQGERTTRQFGPKMMVGYIPDPFGHPGQTPQILRGFGIETSCLWRGLDEEPAEFWWRSPDGSQVLMLYLRESYSNGAALPAENLPAFAEALAAQGNLLAAHSAVEDHLIMFGTDHMEPPANTSQAIAYANKALKNTRVVHSTLPDFVAAVKASLKKRKTTIPTIAGELRACRRMHLLPGVLSTRMWIKQRNQACETLLEKWVEPFAAFEALVAPKADLGQTLHRKSELIRQTWRLLMENHPHDSICGCSIDQVHDEMKVRFDQVEQIGEELARQSLETLAAQVDVSSPDPNVKSAVVVFNPASQRQTDCVTVRAESQGRFEVVDEAGKTVPHQMLGSSSEELINAVMSKKELKSGLSMIQEGKILGKVIHEATLQRQGSQVRIEVLLAETGEKKAALWDARMKEIQALLADPEVSTFHVRARSAPAAEFLFTAQDVPGIGYKTYWLRALPAVNEGAAQPMKVGALVRWLMPLASSLTRLPVIEKLLSRPKSARPPYVIENEFLRVEAAAGDGTLTVKDKRTGAVYRGLNRFADSGDCGDEYNFSPPPVDSQSTARLHSVRLHSGPVRQTLELHLEMKTPLELTPDRKSRSKQTVTLPIISRVTLTAGVPRVDVRAAVENRARDHRLRVHFPAPFAAASGQHDGHFEIVERKVGLPGFDESWVEQPRPEVPQRAFTQITGGKHGLTLANRGLPEVEALQRADGQAEIALTLLRCVGWLSRDDFSTRKGHAGPYLETPGAQMPGAWTFDYAIIPHAADGVNNLAAIRQAYAFETPLRAVSASLHDGELPAMDSFVHVEPAEFVVSAVKPAESGEGWLVRGYNLTGEALDVTLKPWRPFKKAERANLAEEKQATLKAARDGSLTLKVRGHEILSVIFRD